MERLPRLGQRLALCGALVAVLVAVPQQLLLVRGTSMVPSLTPGQVLLLNRPLYRLAPPHRGDLVVFHHALGAGDAEGELVKRIIGVPGDLVQIDTGRVFVNGARLDEPYVRDFDDYTYPQGGGPLRVPDNAYFVLGDNRPLSADSHLGWFVAADELVAQALPLPLVVPPQPASPQA